MSVYNQQAKNVRFTWLLIFAFVGLTSVLFYALATYLNQPFLIVIGLLISLGQSLIAYFYGGNIAISMAGGVEVKEGENMELQNMVENLSRTAGIPKPKIFISPDQSANAFACGRDPEHANICLNQGILDILDKNQLEGVVAHELSHVKNRDILVMTMVSVMSSIITFVTDFGMRSMFFGGGFGGNSDDGDNKSPLVFILYLAVLVLAPVISLLISMSVSRQREYLADATAVTLTRYPKGLIEALSKLHKSPIPSDHYSSATNHFYIAPPKMKFGENVSGLFSTHPPLELRIEALRKM
jgi:heat shock protein HtpX